MGINKSHRLGKKMGPPAANSSSNNSDTNNKDDTTTSTSNKKNSNNVAARSFKKSTDSDLKGSVIEFMEARPFLWNKRHPGYKDHKKRDHEFQEFSTKIGCSVQEIKRVWHVLRTNFFRAHKILSDKPQGAQIANSASQNGTEKVWKYYSAMLYILEGSNLDFPKSFDTTSKGGNSGLSGGNQAAAVERVHNTGKRVSNRLANNVTSSEIRDTTSALSEGGGSRTVVLSNGTSITSADTSSANTPNSKLSTFNETLLDEDDDFLYARSLSLTLRKFDPTTKEVVKLKFQEIIVEYMQLRQKQQQQLQQQQLQQQPQPQLQLHSNHQPPRQLSQLEPPPPSEIANMEASLANIKKSTSDNDEVT